MDSGIYLIQVGDRKYVGQARDIKKRWGKHKSELKHNNHINSYMQRLWNKYSEQFEFIVIEYCNPDELNDKEVYWINELNTLSPNGMNLKHGGNVRTPSDETKERMSKSHTGLHIKEKNSMFGKHLYGKDSAAFGKRPKNSASKYSGVTRDKRETATYWFSRIRLNGKKIHIGCFKTELEAAVAYDLYVIANNLPNQLNFDRGNYD